MTRTYLAALTLLVALLAHPVDAQYSLSKPRQPRPYELDNPSHSAWLPLQVGNQWTYEHVYWNDFSDGSLPFGFNDFSPLQQAILRIILRGVPNGGLEPTIKRFTIKITHTEKEAPPYYVFSDVPYDWPPVPNFFFAGKKVTITGAFPGPDLYKFSPQLDPYFIPSYPLLYDGSQRGTLRIVQFEFWHADDPQIQGHIPSTPPASLSQETAVSFYFSSEGIELGEVWFVSGYGLVSYELTWWGTGWHQPFRNEIYPVSAVIDGKEIEYPYKNPGITHVQPTSWGQVKAHYGQGP